MNDVFVNGKALRKERDTATPEYREAVIRDFVNTRKGKVIRGEDFQKALDGYTGYNAFILKLIKQGKLTRYKAGKGKAYGYTWHESSYKADIGSILKNSPARIIKKLYATELQLKQLDDWYMDYCDSEDSVDGANRFRKFIHNKAKEDQSDQA